MPHRKKEFNPGYLKLPSEPKERRGLKAKTPLKSKVGLKARVVPKKQAQPTITKLRKKADKLFSQYIRLRDSIVATDDDGNKMFYGTCITCSYNKMVAWKDETGKLRFTKGWDAGHLISRGNLFLRYDEENVNLQDSYRCNRMRSGEIEKYREAVDVKYGAGTAKKLEMLAAVNRNHHLKREDLEQVIHDAQIQIYFYAGML